MAAVRQRTFWAAGLPESRRWAGRCLPELFRPQRRKLIRLVTRIIFQHFPRNDVTAFPRRST
jgi:hypothetical protein